MDERIDYYPTRYEHSEKITHDFVTILFAFCFVKNLDLKAKLGYENISGLMRFYMKLFKRSLTWNWIEVTPNGKTKSVNPISKVGNWLWKKGVKYPNPIYQIFPPPFGKNHVQFMESCFSLLNGMEMPKADWETLLNWVNIVCKSEDTKQKYNKAIDSASSTLWKAFCAEKYLEYVVMPTEE